ncbi:MAG: Spi family protease inhibitor, partial [Bacteroidales bacterium]|nr:Spi family protease inhibitor [Bacteroidales bacterium]
MKKQILTLVIVGLITLNFNLYSQVTDFEAAELIAKKAFTEVLSKELNNVEISDYYIKTLDNQPVLYIFKESDGGFVIVSGEERTVPVLAYSTEDFAS